MRFAGYLHIDTKKPPIRRLMMKLFFYPVFMSSKSHTRPQRARLISLQENPFFRATRIIARLILAASRGGNEAMKRVSLKLMINPFIKERSHTGPFIKLPARLLSILH